MSLESEATIKARRVHALAERVKEIRDIDPSQKTFDERMIRGMLFDETEGLIPALDNLLEWLAFKKIINR